MVVSCSDRHSRALCDCIAAASCASSLRPVCVSRGHSLRREQLEAKKYYTVEKRDSFRAFLDSNHYKTGPVSVDASDWYCSQRLSARLKKNPDADRLAYRDAYLRHLYDRAQYYDGLSRTVLGRSVAHVLLLHHNLINALFLKDVIQMFRDKGWTLIDSETAFQDPLYAMRPDILPAGESILWALAKQKGTPGLRYPGEDDIYEKAILDRLHL